MSATRGQVDPSLAGKSEARTRHKDTLQESLEGAESPGAIALNAVFPGQTLITPPPPLWPPATHPLAHRSLRHRHGISALRCQDRSCIHGKLGRSIFRFLEPLHRVGAIVGNALYCIPLDTDKGQFEIQ